jgi:MoaA/NifB/PqqE/SkfB family radical SAM enzyme
MPPATKRFKKVYIEISNVCNLQCTFCPEVERDKRFMEPALFEKVVRAVAPLTEEVCFHVMGEPLLHPEFESYAALCENAGVPVNLTTNGILLTPKRFAILLRPAFQQINFSLQSFESNFPGQDDSSYLGKLFDFAQRALRERPDLYVNFRLWNQGTPEASRLAARLRDQIRQRLRSDFNPVWDVRWKKSVNILGRLYVHFDSRFQWPHPAQPRRSTSGFCYGLSSHIGILADGTVVPCCLDKEGVISLGHCGRQSIDDILNSPRATAMREGFAHGLLVEDLCQKCTFISRFDSKVKKLKYAHAGQTSFS